MLQVGGCQATLKEKRLDIVMSPADDDGELAPSHYFSDDAGSSCDKFSDGPWFVAPLDAPKQVMGY